METLQNSPIIIKYYRMRIANILSSTLSTLLHIESNTVSLLANLKSFEGTNFCSVLIDQAELIQKFSDDLEKCAGICESEKMTLENLREVILRWFSKRAVLSRKQSTLLSESREGISGSTMLKLARVCTRVCRNIIMSKDLRDLIVAIQISYQERSSVLLGMTHSLSRRYSSAERVLHAYAKLMDKQAKSIEKVKNDVDVQFKLDELTHQLFALKPLSETSIHCRRDSKYQVLVDQ
mmetsp:Transcript_4353/g.5858  ORF Transcript_4353/g.5858 Transcript_4353/m.5858 type:complete len:236 (-) Transcript_4353:2199-2906(-)